MKTKSAGIILLLVISAQLSVRANGGPAAINAKLIKAFHDAFPLAEKEEWKENDNQYTVYFKDKTVLSEIVYDHEGNFVESERFYTDVHLLPLHLDWELHKKYGDKTVFGISEINSETETEYLIKLEDSKEWITLKGTPDGNLEVVERVSKQS